jgi:hypothetical protein
MSGLFSPKLSILSTWNSTVSQAFQMFRRVKFVVEDTFSWGDWLPAVSGQSGMVVNNITIFNARYLKLFNFLWVTFDIQFVTAAPFSTSVLLSLPATAAAPQKSAQFAATVVSGGGTDAGLAILDREANQIALFRPAAAAYAAATYRITCNGFFEVQ